jgi:photosystem II stability/assembly factor-like uncharacterized protein
MPARWIVAAAWIVVALGACRPEASPAAPSPTAELPPSVTLTSADQPPGPVVALAVLPDGDLLAGVGPSGDPDTGLAHYLYRGHGDRWQRLMWPDEAPVRTLRVGGNLDGTVIFVVPRSSALLGVGQPWGLLRSTDGGQSWQQALKGLNDPFVVDVALSPAFETDRTLVAVTWHTGVFISTDAGDSWQSLSPGQAIEPGGGASPYDLAVALSPDFRGLNRGEIVASYGHSMHLWRASQQVWHSVAYTVTTRSEDIEPPEARLAAAAIAFSPTFAIDATLYIYSAYAGLWRSTDGGETWSLADRGLPTPSPSRPVLQLTTVSTDEVFALLPPQESNAAVAGGTPTTAAPTLYRTRDGGRTWQALQEPLPPGGVSAFYVSPGAEGELVLYLGGVYGGVISQPADEGVWQ